MSFKKHFINVWFTCENLYICNTYNLMSLVVSVYAQNHHLHQGHKHIYQFSKFPSTLFIIVVVVVVIIIIIIVCLCV